MSRNLYELACTALLNKYSIYEFIEAAAYRINTLTEQG